MQIKIIFIFYPKLIQNYFLKILGRNGKAHAGYLPFIHEEKNDWIEQRIGHCEPIECQINVLDKVRLYY